MNGTIIGNVCYEWDNHGVKMHKKVGVLLYYRGENPNAQIRLDVIPPRCIVGSGRWYIANFIASEKVPEPPYVCGSITDGERDIGVINTRQRNHNDDTQYYMQMDVSINSIAKAVKRGVRRAVMDVVDKNLAELSLLELKESIYSAIESTQSNIFLNIRMEG